MSKNQGATLTMELLDKCVEMEDHIRHLELTCHLILSAISDLNSENAEKWEPVIRKRLERGEQQ